MNKLGDYLKEKNISQFASDMGVTRSAVYTWINGEAIPRPETIRKIEVITNGSIRPADWY